MIWIFQLISVKYDYFLYFEKYICIHFMKFQWLLNFTEISVIVTENNNLVYKHVYKYL